ncbi:MAG: DUF3341 domain-containing protein [Verrucomicrobiae bacterium]|nr:DUF3341 domain-containing protein [Verrucomicrobiae bacterium]
MKLHGLLGEFKDIESILKASAAIRDKGFKKWDTYTPFPVHGIEKAMGIKKSLVPKIVFTCGLIGGIGGLGLQWWTNAVNYPWIVSGKPLFSVPANIPIVFETTVLLAAFGAVFGMIFLNKLPQLYSPLFTSKNFSQGATNDKFFVYIEAQDPKFSPDRTRELLESLNAVTVEEIEEEEHAWSPSLSPKMAWSIGSIVFCLILIPPLYIARAQAKDRTTTRVQLIPDMDQQPRVNAQAASTIFVDGRGMRNYVDGTVPRGGAQTNTGYYTGAENEEWVSNPLPVNRALLERGQNRFDIYCAACHGIDGSGNGPIAIRAKRLREPNWVPPLAMTDSTVLERPDGHLFNTITNGIRNMPAYGDQIHVEDRWAIVAYIRALQTAVKEGNVTIQ